MNAPLLHDKLSIPLDGELDLLRAELTDAGLLIERHYSLGLLCLWYNWIADDFQETLAEESPEILAALGAPADTSAADFTMWADGEEKFGWLIKVNKLFQDSNEQITDELRTHWFYADSLVDTLRAAVAWVKGGAV